MRAAEKGNEGALETLAALVANLTPEERGKLAAMLLSGGTGKASAPANTGHDKPPVGRA